MTDFREFGRELRDYLGKGSTDSADEVAARISALGEGDLPPLFRGRSEADLEAYLIRAKEAIRGYGNLFASEGAETRSPHPVSSMLGEPARKPAWNDIGVPSGQDWFFKYDEQPVEARVSVSALARAFGQEGPGGYRDFEEELRDIMTGEGIERRRRLGVESGTASVIEVADPWDDIPPEVLEAQDELVAGFGKRLYAEKSSLLDHLTEFFEARSTMGAEVPTSLHYFARAVSLGDPNPMWYPPEHGIDLDEVSYTEDQLKCDWEHGLVEDEDVFLSGDEIRFKSLGRDGGHLSLLLESDRGLVLVIAPWFGASFWDEDAGLEIPASFWVNGESFEVTLERDGRRV